MTHLQQLFIMGSMLYLMVKLCLFVLLYIITLRVEVKGLAYRKRRVSIIIRRRELDHTIYQKQYSLYEKNKGKTSRRKRRNGGPSLALYGTMGWFDQMQ